jgi:hypothetical protein
LLPVPAFLTALATSTPLFKPELTIFVIALPFEAPASNVLPSNFSASVAVFKATCSAASAFLAAALPCSDPARPAPIRVATASKSDPEFNAVA